MRILFLTDNFPPEVNAPASRTYEHAVRWVRAGARVTVITCAPNFPQGKVYPGYRNRPISRETIDGIEVVRVWSYITANQGFARRTLDYLSFAATSFFAGLFRTCDVIVATSPQFFTTFSGAALARLKRRPWIFELRDIWPESIAAVGATSNPRLIAMLERIELRLYRDAARIVAVTPAFKDNLTARGIPGEKIEIVTNGADLGLWRPREADAALRERFGLRDKFVIAYIGTFGMAHGLDFVIRAAAKVTDPQVHFLFVGDGSERAKLEAQAQGSANVSFHPPVAKQEVPRFLASADAALVPLRRSDTFRSVLPSKIFEAAAMRRPILLGVEGQAAAIVEQHGAGLLFTPEDEDEFVAAVTRLAADRGLYAKLQAGCEGLAAAYDRDRLADQMLAIMRDVAEV